MTSFHSKGQLGKTNIQSVNFGENGDHCYNFGGWFTHVNSLRKHEKSCSYSDHMRVRNTTSGDQSANVLGINGPLLILQLNIRGIKPKTNELSTLLAKYKIDVACIQETLLSAQVNLEVPDYSVESKDRPSGDNGVKVGGGVAFLIRKGIPYVFTPSPHKPRDIFTEVATLRISPSGRSPFDITNVYRPPDTKENDACLKKLHTDAFNPILLDPRAKTA